MPLLVPDVGEVALLDAMLNNDDRTLELFSNNVTPAEGDVKSTYTAATFTGYATKTLTGASWNAASTSSGTTSKTYASQSWSPTSSQTIYGYFVYKTTVLHWAEAFASSKNLSSGDTLTLTPKMQLD